MEGENLPPGFRFHPTDEELISYYLINKVSCINFTSRAMADVDLNKCEPWDLPAKASMGEKEWYFFSMKDRKYPTGMRTNRATEAGYWKTTGKDKEIFSSGVLVGMKKTLVFYKGRAPKGEKTNWVMHEYRLEAKHAFKSSQEEWVVCRVFQKSSTMKRPHQTPSSPQSQESPANEFGDINEILAINSSTGNNNNTTFSQDDDQAFNFDGLNWNAIREAVINNALPSNISWPNYTNLAMNPYLLRALQLKTTFQPPEATSVADYSMILSGMSPLCNDLIRSNLNLTAEVADSSTRRNHLDSVQQQQEEPFNLDSNNIW